MRIPVLLVGLGVLAFSPSQAVALGCLDIPGASIDPDLAALSTNFGRLLPDSKKVNDTRQQSDTIAFERLIATRIQTKDGTASADLVLTSGNITKVTGVIDGEKFNQTTKANIAGLGYSGAVAMLAAALAKIDLPAKAFVPPEISGSFKFDGLSPDTPKLLTGQNKETIKGQPKTETETSIQYTCTQDAEYAGNPNDLSTMVVLKGVIKATTVTTTTKIDRSLNVEMSDVATLQSVSRKEFQSILSTLPGIKGLVQTAQVVTPDPPPPVTSVQLATPESVPPTAVAQENKSVFGRFIDFFSLSEPGTWILLLLAALASALTIIATRRAPQSKDGPTEQEPVKETHKTVMESALREQVASLKNEITTINGQSQELRQERQELKVQLDKAENSSRDLTAQLIELQTSSALLESRLNADKRSVLELESSNERLMGVNDGYRDKINELETEYTALMEKLMQRDEALSKVETLANDMRGINEEITHDLTQERAARASIEAEFKRLSQDYDTLWQQSSDRVEQFRNKTAGQDSEVRELKDEVLSLSAELDAIRKDRDDLNREFFVLSNENSRMSNEHVTATNVLENKIRKLHMELAIFRGLLEENQIQIPQRTRLPATNRRSRDIEEWEAGRLEAYEEDPTAPDNVVPLTKRNSDKAG